VIQSRKVKLLSDMVSYSVLVIVSIFTIFPLLWMVTSSLKSAAELTSNSIQILPEKPTLFYYERVLENTDFLSFIGNSVTVISMALSAFAAYSIVRHYPRFGKIITRVLMTSYMFPPILMAIPYYIVISKVGLANTLSGLVLTYMSFSIPFCIWLLIGYFRTIPVEIEEAARIDGASQLRTFLTIVLPLSAPGLVATAVFTFINAWNEFLFSLVLISSGEKRTVSVGLQALVGGEIMDWGDMMAASVMVVIPSLIFFFLIQRHIASGLTGGAVK
jgi:multiple sugar transport system permease protein